MADQVKESQNWLQYAVLTDVGMRRVNNQDSYTVMLAGETSTWSERGHFFMVADGMGAHAAGELASKLAVDGVPHHYHKYRHLSPPEALQRAITETNAEIHRRGRANIDFHNMGTTASAMALLPQGAIIGHVGDSRIYRLQGDRLEQLTFDHSLLWELRAAGQIAANDDGERGIPKNVITRSLGPNAEVQVDMEGPYAVAVGDTFLLCSDGLTGQVEDEELGLILAHLPVEEAARVLVDLANLRGGPDNSTVIVVRVSASPPVANRPRLFGAPGARPRVHPATWVVTGVCLLAGIGMAVTQNYLLALLAGFGVIAAFGFAVFQSYSSATPSAIFGGGRQSGKGPYTQVVCRANARVVRKLASIAEELREAANHQEWTVDWTRFDGLCREADQALAANQHVQALRHYAGAISFMMQELRSQNRRKARDSAIDY